MLHNPIGAFYSISKGGYKGAFESAVADGATTMHMFAKSPRSTGLRGEYAEAAKLGKEYFKKSPLVYAVFHAGYVHNFAKELTETSYQYQSLIEDLNIAEALGINGVVIHMGKTLENDPVKARAHFVANMATIVKKTKHLKAKLLLENTAGQGSETGYRFDDLGGIFHAVQDALGGDSRFGICLDSQHSFAAGYDWTDAKKAEEGFAEFEREIGFKYLSCVHFNDSKPVCGARKDRHEDIGVGLIGTKGLQRFVKLLNDATKKPIPLLLETPEVAATYKEQIAAVRRWL
ncbi:MAG: hypothetical protein COV10_00745 [Candidatus Vogelbacteria bacterium CG10_big_fil_rev_8_21_14_0_10_51_16]|uniref:Xylose isomerase-like TIM barrel domain-containing protein n=1 Tax=Candidatus Vogelbacteria bacterium CG10_big_fil_rev_8_21_14_0_10_51_16 TaxID=1975045 RepID=A0A2H0RF77_9BACT|nr:MAG: hypothetical protein COV10_00745 [Candidatus Vogelbacteria bacterium CG10_big_fil_rev_8_21_14_0_10_51_16]